MIFCLYLPHTWKDIQVSPVFLILLTDLFLFPTAASFFFLSFLWKWGFALSLYSRFCIPIKFWKMVDKKKAMFSSSTESFLKEDMRRLCSSGCKILTSNWRVPTASLGFFCFIAWISFLNFHFPGAPFLLWRSSSIRWNIMDWNLPRLWTLWIMRRNDYLHWHREWRLKC